MPQGEQSSVNARIVYWGIAGSGKSTNLRTVHAKLRPENRGDLRQIPTRVDPTVSYESLPIELGEMSGIRTRIEIVAAPSGSEHVPTRKQLLDGVNGIVLVLDPQPGKREENLRACTELRQSLEAYGERLAELPLVLQYNKRDLCDANDVEALHRELALDGAAAFDAVATEGKGVLPTLTTISKLVVKQLRDRTATGAAAATSAARAAAPVASAAAPVAEPAAAWPESDEIDDVPAAAPRDTGSSSWMEEAILREGDTPDDTESIDALSASGRGTLDQPFDELAKDAIGARIGGDLEIVSIGQAERTGPRALRIPLVLGNAEGETVTLALSLGLDPLVDSADENER